MLASLMTSGWRGDTALSFPTHAHLFLLFWIPGFYDFMTQEG